MFKGRIYQWKQYRGKTQKEKERVREWTSKDG